MTVLSFTAKKGLDPVEKLLPHFHPLLHCVESNALTNMKLKLQLFPIDDGTRRALEMVSTKMDYADNFVAEEIQVLTFLKRWHATVDPGHW